MHTFFIIVHMAETAQEGHPFRKMYMIFFKIYSVYAFSWIDFSPDLMGPFSLVQSRTLDLEIVEKLEKKFLKGCPKFHVFMVNNKGGKKRDAKQRNFIVKLQS